MSVQTNPSQEQIHDLINLYQSGQTAQAGQTCRALLQTFPQSAIILNIHGAVLIKQDRLQEALIEIDKAIQLQPDYAEAYNNRGNAQTAVGNLNAALKDFDKALMLKPDMPGFHANRGNTLQELGRLKDAIESFNNAIRLKPDYAEVYNHRGQALAMTGRLREAVESCNTALKLRPDYAEAYTCRGTALQDLGLFDEAIDSFRHALALDTDNAEAISGLLFTLNYHPALSRTEIFNEHSRLGKRLGRSFSAYNSINPATRHVNPRLRIGYVSADFRVHSVAYFLEPLLRHHDRSSFEIYCYYNDLIIDEKTRCFQHEAEHWRTIAKMDDNEVVEQIKQDNIDILIDLSGHSWKGRLPVFARKPAPVQVSWLGYPNTTGLDTIDYRFTDETADPAGEADTLHSERLYRLPNGFLCYQGDESVNSNTALPCIERGHITFGCFNKLTKVTPRVIRLWAAILHAVPDSHLLLKSSQLSEPELRLRYRDMLINEGIPEERFELLSWLADKAEHMKLYNDIDIGLDPFPYNGTTTTCEALWMGVPVITLRGDRHSSRVGASIMTHAGLTEFIATDADEYLTLAAGYANNTDLLAGYRTSLRNKLLTSELCDARGFTRSVEAACTQLWNQYNQQSSN